MKTLNVHAAKTHLSRLLDEVADGEEIVIAKAGRPVARLVPFAPSHSRRRFGSMKGRIRIRRDFEAPLPDDLARAFGVK